MYLFAIFVYFAEKLAASTDRIFGTRKKISLGLFGQSDYRCHSSFSEFYILLRMLNTTKIPLFLIKKIPAKMWTLL